jgi:hypothetical protein
LHLSSAVLATVQDLVGDQVYTNARFHPSVDQYAAVSTLGKCPVVELARAAHFLNPAMSGAIFGVEIIALCVSPEHEATGAIQSHTSSSNTLCDVNWLLFQKTQLWFQKAAVLWFG